MDLVQQLSALFLLTSLLLLQGKSITVFFKPTTRSLLILYSDGDGNSLVAVVYWEPVSLRQMCSKCFDMHGSFSNCFIFFSKCVPFLFLAQLICQQNKTCASNVITYIL